MTPPVASTARRYALGVDLGTTYTCAAVADESTRAQVAQLTGTSQTIPSVVSIGAEGVLAGDAAERRLVSHPNDTAREFKRRLGDPVPVVLAGETYGAEVLTGHLLAEVVARVSANEGSAPATTALAHPASWGPFRLDLLREAATQAGVGDVVLVPEPVAAALANRDRVEDGSLVAVYDLGGGTFDAAVVQAEGDWSVVGTPEGVERLGGVDFDQAVLAHVDAALDGQIFALDTSDPDARSAVMQLRRECQEAKEHLSSDTDVEIPVSIPGVHTSVRLTRAEFEAMVRPRLADSLAVFDRVVASAGASWEDIAAVLLVGGSSSIPVVGQMVAEHTGRPIVTATNPHMAIALGTAMVAAEQLAPVPAVEAQPTPADPEPSPAESAPAAPSASPAAAASGDGSRSRVPLIGAALAAVAVIVVVLVVVLGGGGDDDAPAADAEADDEAPADDSEESDTASPSNEDSATAELAEAATVESCGTLGSDVVAVLEQDGQLVLVGSDGVAALAGPPAGCPTDLTDRAVDPSIELPAAPVAAASNGDALVVATPSGGVIVNAATGNVIPCAALTGPLATTPDAAVFPIDGGVVGRLRTSATGCDPADNSSLVGIDATAVGVADGDRIAVGGVVDGVPELWVFRSQDERVVLGGSGTAVPNGIGSVDGIVVCESAWCVLDLDREVVHIIELSGTYRAARVLEGTALEGATAIIGSGSATAGPALIVADVEAERVLVTLAP